MRYLDLAVATLIGMSTVTALVVLSPSPIDTAAAGQMSVIQARDELLGYLQRQGSAWLLLAPPVAVCGSLGSLSSPTVSFSAVINGHPCRVPPTGATVVNLTLSFSSRKVVLEAWSVGAA